MGRVLLCVGRKAQKPYYIGKMGVQAWSAEELCFLLRKNAYLLDGSIQDRRLAVWLGEECGLETLSRSLSAMLRAGCTLPAFVGTILSEVAYCSPEEIEAVERLLKNNEGLSGSEKQKLHADYLLQAGRCGAALREYEALLDGMEEDDPLRLRILHNMGVACAGQLRFARAAELFLEVSRATGEEEEQECYLAALRMQLPSDEYVRRIGEMPEQTARSLELEKKLAQLRLQWRESRTGQQWRETTACRREGQNSAYYEKTQQAIAELKEQYRENMADVEWQQRPCGETAAEAAE